MTLYKTRKTKRIFLFALTIGSSVLLLAMNNNFLPQLAFAISSNETSIESNNSKIGTLTMNLKLLNGTEIAIMQEEITCGDPQVSIWCLFQDCPC